MTFDTGTFVSQLDTERVGLEERRVRLIQELQSVEARIADIQAVVDGIRRLEGSDNELSGNEPYGSRPNSTSPPLLIMGTEPDTPIAGTRRRSTEEVASIVDGSPEGLSRQEIHAEYDRTFGIPESWTVPQNALNNAIGRAVKKGLIVERGGRLFPRGS
ncbi:hypothetical protein [Herbiconiux sp. UC225_62]|uniref:hypothetical protein n=1 Tax=Herbiconiux sp. UC225_62 TaxID=3350168 RepID=UPI0036D38FE0